MIRSFASRKTERLWNAEPAEGLPEVIQRTAYRKLLLIDSAPSLFVLSKLGGNRLEKLRGDREGQYSIRINDQWRIFAGKEQMRSKSKSSITTEKAMKKNDLLAGVSAGEILAEEFLKPMGISQYALAKAINVPETRVSAIIRGKRRLTPDTALRLGAYFETGPEFWLKIQTSCELRAAREKVPNDALKKIRPFRQMDAAKKKAA